VTLSRIVHWYDVNRWNVGVARQEYRDVTLCAGRDERFAASQAGEFRGQHGVVGDQDAPRVGGTASEGVSSLLDLASGHVARFPAPPWHRIEPYHDEVGEGDDRFEVLSDHLLIRSVWPEHALGKIDEREVVIAGNDEDRARQLVQELSSSRELGLARSLCEIARDDNEVGPPFPHIDKQGLGPFLDVGPEVKVRDMGDHRHSSIMASRDGGASGELAASGPARIPGRASKVRSDPCESPIRVKERTMTAAQPGRPKGLHSA
jgi:hypothetical protein